MSVKSHPVRGLLATMVLGVASALIERSGPIRLRHWAEKANGHLLALYSSGPRFSAFRFLLSFLARLAPIVLVVALWEILRFHHFDLVNWWLADTPARVYARGGLRFYGADAAAERGQAALPERGTHDGPHDPFELDLRSDERLEALYLEAERHDELLVVDHAERVEAAEVEATVVPEEPRPLALLADLTRHPTPWPARAVCSVVVPRSGAAVCSTATRAATRRSIARPRCAWRALARPDVT